MLPRFSVFESQNPTMSSLVNSRTGANLPDLLESHTNFQCLFTHQAICVVLRCVQPHCFNLELLENNIPGVQLYWHWDTYLDSECTKCSSFPCFEQPPSWKSIMPAKAREPLTFQFQKHLTFSQHTSGNFSRSMIQKLAVLIYCNLHMLSSKRHKKTMTIPICSWS